MFVVSPEAPRCDVFVVPVRLDGLHQRTLLQLDVDGVVVLGLAPRPFFYVFFLLPPSCLHPLCILMFSHNFNMRTGL